jgi:hypothetical protein
MLDMVRAEVIEEVKGLAPVVQEAQASQAVHLMKKSTEAMQGFTAAIEKTCDTLLRRLDEPVVPGLQGSIDEILQVMRAEKQPPPLNTKRLVGLALGLVLVSGSLGWYVGQTPAVIRQRASLMEHVHGVLVERYPTVPTELKAKLTTVYTQHGFALEPPRGSKP